MVGGGISLAAPAGDIVHTGSTEIIYSIGVLPQMMLGGGGPG